MKVWRFKFCAVALALAILPGIVEVLENASHLVTEGHAAHAQAEGDKHEPSGPEHGCTPTFHLCGCHASLAFLGAQSLPAIHLRTVGLPARLDLDRGASGFSPAVDRPPRV